MAIVLSVIAIIWGTVVILKNHFQNRAKPETPIAVTEETVQYSNNDEGELLAVLTAAVAASLGTSTYNLKIRSYRRIQSTSSVWNTAGRGENI